MVPTPHWLLERLRPTGLTQPGPETGPVREEPRSQLETDTPGPLRSGLAHKEKAKAKGSGWLSPSGSGSWTRSSPGGRGVQASPFSPRASLRCQKHPRVAGPPAELLWEGFIGSVECWRSRGSVRCSGPMKTKMYAFFPQPVSSAGVVFCPSLRHRKYPCCGLLF